VASGFRFAGRFEPPVVDRVPEPDVAFGFVDFAAVALVVVVEDFLAGLRFVEDEFDLRGAAFFRRIGSASPTALTAAPAASPTVSTTLLAVLPAVLPTLPAVFPTVFMTSPG
jgi:hypothetical protein